jgi:hypothetical protein
MSESRIRVGIIGVAEMSQLAEALALHRSIEALVRSSRRGAWVEVI